MASMKSRETYIRRLAGYCGCKIEKIRDPSQYDGWPYILRDGTTGKILGTNDLEEFEAYMRERYPERLPRKNNDWSDILLTAAEIVEDYDTGVTLRQLFYQLVIRQLIENNINRYGLVNGDGGSPPRWHVS